jgi:hypothetical protein
MSSTLIQMIRKLCALKKSGGKEIGLGVVKSTLRYLTLWGLQYGHLPSNSFLALLSNSTTTFRAHIEVRAAGYKLYDELVKDKDKLIMAVRSLNTIRRKGKENVSILSLVEEDGIEE